MKILIVLLVSAGLFVINNSVYGNSIFSQDTSLLKFKKIVGSLTAIYKDSGLTRKYASLPHSNGVYFRFESDEANWRELLGAMNRESPYSEVMKKFRDHIKINEQVYFITKQLKKDNDKAVTKVTAWNRHGNFDYEISFENAAFFFSDSLKGKWLYNSSAYNDKYILYGFYLTSGFSRQVLPDKYARFIFYADIITDSSSSVFYENNTLAVKEAYSKEMQKAHPKLKKYLKYSDYNEKPDSTKYKSPEAYDKAFKSWHTRRNKELVRLLKVPKYKTAFDDALHEALNTGIIYRQLLLDAEQVLPPERILDLERCIQLDPDKKTYLQHMTEMNRNAAESNDWSTFIRTYLEMLQYQPTADVKALKMLGIDMDDLIKGLMLTAGDVPANHYSIPFSNQENLLAFADRSEQFEKEILQMVLDEQLDDHNRLLMYLTYVKLIYNTDNIKEVNRKVTDLKDEIDFYPHFIRIHIRDLKLIESE